MHIPQVTILAAPSSIRGRILPGFAVMILLLILAGVTGRTSLTSVGEQIGTSLAATRKKMQLTALLQGAGRLQQIVAELHTEA